MTAAKTTPPTIYFYDPFSIDSFCAAWIAHKAMGEHAEVLDKSYIGQADEDIQNRRLVLMGLVFDDDTMMRLCGAAEEVVIFTHMEDLARNISPTKVVYDSQTEYPSLSLFAWIHFFGDLEGLPLLVQYIDDFSSSALARPYTTEVIAALSSRPRTTTAWDEMEAMSDVTLWTEGGAIIRELRKILHQHLAHHAFRGNIAGWNVPVVNAMPPFIQSAGTTLAKEADFACCYTDGPGQTLFFLFSEEGGEDVGKIARRFGGNGTEHQATFKLKVEEWGIG